MLRLRSYLVIFDEKFDDRGRDSSLMGLLVHLVLVVMYMFNLLIMLTKLMVTGRSSIVVVLGLWRDGLYP